jgi:hypothetical protein
MEHCAMSKRGLKKNKRRSKAVVPALGITGLFLSLAKRSNRINRRSDDEFTGDFTTS